MQDLSNIHPAFRYEFERPRPAPAPPVRDFGYTMHAISTPQNTALPAHGTHGSHTQQKPLEDVPEEPEISMSRRGSSHYTPSPPSTPFRHHGRFVGSKSTTPVQVKPSIQDPPQPKSPPRPDSQMSDTLGIFGEQSVMVTAATAKGAGASSTSYTFLERSASLRESEGSWEDDIDYCYKHEAEADCDFDWSNVSRLELEDEPIRPNTVCSGSLRRRPTVRRPRRKQERKSHGDTSAADDTLAQSPTSIVTDVTSKESLPELEQDHASAYTPSIISVGVQTPLDRLSSPSVELHSPGRSRWFPVDSDDAGSPALDEHHELATASEPKQNLYESFVTDSFEGHDLHAILDSAGRATKATRARFSRALASEDGPRPRPDSVVVTARMLREASSSTTLDEGREASASSDAKAGEPVTATTEEGADAKANHPVQPIQGATVETPVVDGYDIPLRNESLPPPIPPRVRPFRSVSGGHGRVAVEHPAMERMRRQLSEGSI